MIPSVSRHALPDSSTAPFALPDKIHLDALDASPKRDDASSHARLGRYLGTTSSLAATAVLSEKAP
jgi:hypothetical protein